YFVEGMQPEVEAGVRAAVRELERLGAVVEPVSLPHTEYAIATYYLIATAEASSNLARYDGIRYGLRIPADSLGAMYETSRAAGFGTEVKRRIMLGTYALSAGYYDAYYLKAQQVRTLIRRDFEQAFQHCEALVTPVAPTTAFRLGEKVADPLTMYLSDIFTISVNLAGLPGLVVPCGFDTAGLPIGLQVLGRPFDEETVLRVGAGRAEELLLPRSPQGLSDQHVRGADLHRRLARRATRRRHQADRPHAHPHGRGHGEEHPRRARRREPRRLQPLRRAVARDRERARHADHRRGRRVPAHAALDPHVPRDLRR